MASLIVLVFAIELAVQLVNTIGAATINSLLWRAYTSLPTQLAKDFSGQRKLQKEFLACRRDLSATSSQDQFAKWARLRRTHDKLLEQLEKKKSSLEVSKATFDRYVTTARWILTRGLQWFLPFWYAKEPMFWLPYGWFPYYVEWFLSFPRAPLGSVSIVAWQWACAGVLTLVSETIAAVLGLILSSRQKQRSAPMETGKSGSQTEEQKARAKSS